MNILFIILIALGGFLVANALLFGCVLHAVKMYMKLEQEYMLEDI